jgi:hypothetical protein
MRINIKYILVTSTTILVALDFSLQFCIYSFSHTKKFSTVSVSVKR